MTSLPLVEKVLASQNQCLTERANSRLDTFLSALYEYNSHTNLTRIPAEEAERLHVCDSLLVNEFIPKGAKVLDVGTGGGFPGWVLACVRPDITVTSIDSSGKALVFLKSQPLQNFNVINQRAEEYVRREEYDFVTGRAVAPFSIQAEISAAWVKVGGLFVPFRTPPEITQIERFRCEILGFILEKVEERTLPESQIKRLFPVFSKSKPTDEQYPRIWSKIKSHPLSRL